MHAVLTFIRSYRHNIADLIDFRATCLSGVSVTIRERAHAAAGAPALHRRLPAPLRARDAVAAGMNVWNHRQQSVAFFVNEHKLDIENVLHTIMLGIGGMTRTRRGVTEVR